MKHVGSIILTLGLFMILIGLLLILSEKIPFIGNLPGDIKIKKDNYSFYFPITTCILISIILSLLLSILSKFFGK